MGTAPKQQPRVDQFFTGAEARHDRWRTLLRQSRQWESSTTKQGAEAKSYQSQVLETFEELRQWEGYFAYPGWNLLATLKDRITSGDAVGTTRLARAISTAIVTHSYRTSLDDWEREEDSVGNLADRLPLSSEQRTAYRPYFEVLFVSPARQSMWADLGHELRKLRRPQDKFAYESVFVGSFEDAILAVILNGSFEAVVIYDDVPFASVHNNPVLREFLTSYFSASGIDADSLHHGLTLAQALKLVRPELDIYLLSDREVEKAAGSPEAASVRRIFYQVEEPLELHLSVLDGVSDRFSTPYFDNLQKYAQKPMGTFHALPVARGKSIFKSNWIRDMGEFYGLNLFLAESSATTGGLDSLLEPTGNIKVAQDYAARAFGADRVFFVTNGTSTSNKMVEQALLAPGDIMLVDRNCHKSHHYGAVLSGALPLYVEAYPLTQYSMYGAVPLRTIKKALLDLKAEGKLDRARMLVLTNCTFDGHIYNVERVMEECLAIKPDLIFLWDEAWFGFARFTPFYRRRTAMGAAATLEKRFQDPAYRAAYQEQAKKLGNDPSQKTLLDTRLLANPDTVHLRVYQTNSTHKSMSCLRQGSMVLVKDQDYHTVEEQFHEAVFTHASTSPNLQIIASIDVARRQMELEGYELVNRAIQLALDLRREVNTHPLVSKYFRILGADELIPAEFRNSGFVDYLSPGANWGTAIRALREDEFALDVTRLTLVCGSAGFDGTQFKNLLAAEYDVQLNKTSRNSVLLQTNINNTRSDIAHLMKVLVEISQKIDKRLAQGGKREQEAFDGETSWRTVTVPGPWAASLPDWAWYTGEADYRRIFSVPREWQQREVVLHFGAVNYQCEVRVNGRLLGSHEGGYLPFSFVLPADQLDVGLDFELDVHVRMPSASSEEFPFGEIPHGKQSWYGPLGGIWQSVRLEVRDRRHVEHVGVVADAEGRIKVSLQTSAAAAGCHASLFVFGTEPRIVAGANLVLTGSDEVSLSVDYPALWSPAFPNLYTLQIVLAADGAIVDMVSQSFGFRTIEARDGKIWLNGEPIYLRGALDQDYHADGISTPPSLEYLEDQARKAKALGLNLLRCHIKVPDPRYYDVADRLGLLIWTEIPNVARFTEKSAQRLRDTLAGIVRRDGSHPSIIAWTIINEDWGTRLIEDATHRSWLKETFDWLKSADPTRLVVDNSACFPNFHVKTDLNDYHYYRSVPERREEWDHLTQSFATGTEWTFSPHGDAEQRGDEPRIVSEFGVWGLPDPKALIEWDGAEPFWFESGSDWADGVVYPHGVEQRARTFGLIDTFGSFDAFIKAAQWYQFDNLKYEIESIRAQAAIQGYVITELTDTHWESNGLLDMKRNIRVFHSRFAEFNTDLVLVPQPARYAAWAGDELPIRVLLATGAASVPAGAVVTSIIDDQPGPSLLLPQDRKPEVLALGTIDAQMPALTESAVVTVEFQLADGDRQLSCNSVNIAVYPRRASEQSITVWSGDSALAAYLGQLGYSVVSADAADVRVVRSLDAADQAAINAGAHYLVLADQAGPGITTLRRDEPQHGEQLKQVLAEAGERRDTLSLLPNIGVVERDGTIWRGDWVASFTWLRRDGAFSALPGGPMVDMSFSNVAPHHLLTGLRAWQAGGEVRAGLVVGWVRKPAAIIVDRVVGKGRMVATTFRLTGEPAGADPVAATLMDALLATAADHD